MLAHKNAVFNETFETIYKLNKDEVARYWAEAREEALRISQSTEQLYKKSLEEKDKALAEKDKSLAEKDKALEEKDKSLTEKNKALAEKDIEIARLQALLEQK